MGVKGGAAGQAGRAPENALLLMFRVFSCVRLTKVAGMVPDSELPPRLSFVSAERLPISAGMVPLSWFC